MSFPDFSQLDALVSIISSSVEKVKSEWKLHGYHAPSLDSVDPHPMDDANDQTLQMKQTIQTIEGACAQLVATILPPARSLLNVGSAVICEEPHFLIHFLQVGAGVCVLPIVIDSTLS